MERRAAVLMSGSEMLAAYDAVHEQIAELETYGAEIVARMEKIGYAKELGASDTARLLTSRYRLDPAEAQRRVKFAKNLHKYAAVAAALPLPGKPIPPDGGVVLHMGQARAIVSALEQIPAAANVPVEDLVQAEHSMVQAAREMAPGALRSMGIQVRNILDTDGPEPREDAARRKEDLWLTKTDDGVRFGGNLAAENAELLQTLIQSGAKPHKTADGAPDSRSRGKRQADALADILNLAAGSGDLPGRGGIKPHITVLINLDDLIAAGKTTTGDLIFGDGLSAGAIRMLACDAGVIPVVLGSNSEPLDVGREHRFILPALRNALIQRDRGCVICGSPPIYCDAHHLTSWLDGGATSLSNSVLLCRVHHTALHQGHWTITITNNKVHVTRPTWADPPPRHRQPPPPNPTAPANPAAPATDTCPTPSSTAATAESASSAAAPSAPPEPAPADADSWPPLITADDGTSHTPTRLWTSTGDVPWITPEEAATFDPWADSA